MCPSGIEMTVTRIAPTVVEFVGNDIAGDGSPDNPYGSVVDAIQTVQANGTLIFKAGSVNTFSGGPLVIDRPMTLMGYDVRIE